MSKSKKAEFEIKVGGEPYVWRLQRVPAWSSDAHAFVGMAIALRHAEGQREAVVEFPAPPQPRYGAPILKANHVDLKLVANAIVSAIGAGWDPHSRGKTVTIVVDATGA